jgi:hypothetical protein
MTRYERPSPYAVRMTTTLPPMFAIASLRSDTVAIFDATPVTEHPYDRHESPTYLIRPHLFCQREHLPSFTIPDRPANHYMPHVTLTAATPIDSTRERDRHIIFRGECRPSDLSVYSIYHPEAIPIYVFESSSRVGWPSHHDNVLPVFPGDRLAYRFWLRRWDPDDVYVEYTRSRRTPLYPEAQSSHQAPQPQSQAAPLRQSQAPLRPSQAAPLRQSQSSPLPKFVADALIAAAVAASATCPITMEPIEATKASVTPCYHVFDSTAIASWSAAGNTTCPTCKQPLI